MNKIISANKEINPVVLICLLLILLVAAGLGALIARNTPVADARPRLVILYAPCSVNKNYLHPYNSSVFYTPNLSFFARQSLTFKRHVTQESFSGGAYASLFTGTYPDRHGVYFHPSPLNPRNYTITEAFHDNGYETFFWSIHALASPELNYGQGVEAMDVIKRQPGDAITLTELDPAFMKIIRRLNQDPAYQAFIQVNFSVSHSPYTTFSPIETTISFCKSYPDECSGVTEQELRHYSGFYEDQHVALTFRWNQTVQTFRSQNIDLEKLVRVVEIIYKSCIHLLDDRFGRMMNVIRFNRLASESLIVFTADHGEVLFSKHASVHWGHGQLEPEILNVPLIIKMPNGWRKIGEYEKVTRAIDVFPTIAALCRLHLPEQKFDGLNLARAILGIERAPDLLAFSNNEIAHPAAGTADPQDIAAAVRDQDIYYRLTATTSGSRLLQLIPGADAWQDFIPRSEREREIADRLRNFRARLVAGYKQPKEIKNAEEIREKLKSLGYLQ